MKIGSAGRRIEGRKNRSSRLEIQIWSAVNCHSREAGPWSMIVFVLLQRVPSTWIGGGGEKGEESSSNRTIPSETRYWITIVNEEIRGQASRGGKQTAMEIHGMSFSSISLLECLPLLSPFLLRTNDTILSSKGEFQPGAESMRLSWEAYAVFVLTIRSARSCFQRDETLREFTRLRAGCDSPPSSPLATG